MNARPDHRRVLENLDLGWPAETLTWAQEQYDAEMRRFRPDDPGPYERDARFEARDDFDRHALRAPVRPVTDPGPARVVTWVTLSAGAVVGLSVIFLLAQAWGL